MEDYRDEQLEDLYGFSTSETFELVDYSKLPIEFQYFALDELPLEVLATLQGYSTKSFGGSLQKPLNKFKDIQNDQL